MPTTSIKYPTFTLEVDYDAEAPESEVGFNGSFEINDVTLHVQLMNGKTQTANVYDLVNEFDLWEQIEEKVIKAIRESAEDEQAHQDDMRYDLFKEMRIYDPNN